MIEPIQNLGLLVCVAKSGLWINWASRTKLRGTRFKTYRVGLTETRFRIQGLGGELMVERGDVG